MRDSSLLLQAHSSSGGSRREREIQPSHRPEQWFTVRVRNPRAGSHSHAWYTVGFVVIACRDFLHEQCDDEIRKDTCLLLLAWLRVLMVLVL